jgi:hypothetical protein
MECNDVDFLAQEKRGATTSAAPHINSLIALRYWLRLSFTSSEPALFGCRESAPYSTNANQ